MKKYNIAVVGATGNVGRNIINILAERNFPYADVYALASKKSVGKEISFGEKNILTVEALEDFDFTKINIVLASAGGSVSKQFVPAATAVGSVVIDNSSYYRMDKDVPLIVPEVNPNLIKNYKNKGVIANPNCSVIAIATALKPLDNAAKIKRIVISTYQSVSGAGKQAMDDLYAETKNMYFNQMTGQNEYSERVAFNIIPKIDEYSDDGYTLEEIKIMSELKKILGDQIEITATCVRVPVFIGHCASINIEFHSQVTAEEVYDILSEADGITAIDPSAGIHITPKEIVGEDNVYVSRVRQDKSTENCINMWVVSDNLRKGAALNAVQIAELLIKEI